MKEDNFILPLEWYLLIDEYNRNIVNSWRLIKHTSATPLNEDSNYKYITVRGWGLVKPDSNSGIEITTYQFKRYVLKDIDMDENGIIEEDLDYLIELFKKLKIE